MPHASAGPGKPNEAEFAACPSPLAALKRPAPGATSVQGARRVRGAAAAKRGRVGPLPGRRAAGFRAAARPVAVAHTGTTEPAQSHHGGGCGPLDFPGMIVTTITLSLP